MAIYGDKMTSAFIWLYRKDSRTKILVNISQISTIEEGIDDRNEKYYHISMANRDKYFDIDDWEYKKLKDLIDFVYEIVGENK